MRVRDDVGQEAWDAFVASRSEAQFVQSWAWGVFQQKVGNDVCRWTVEVDGKTVGACQAFVKAHGLGIRSFGIFRAPIVDDTQAPDAFGETLHNLWTAITERAKRLGVTHIHIDPGFLDRSPGAALLSRVRRFVPAQTIQPQCSLLLSLPRRGEGGPAHAGPGEVAGEEQPLPGPLLPRRGSSMEEMLAQMHEKTRYNIRLAERKGVAVRQSTDEKDIDTFISLTRVTAKRDGITAYSDAHFRAMVRTLGDAGLGTLFLAEHDGNVLAVNFVVSYGDTVTYLHGASGNENRNLMAPHLLQWRQMEWAMEQGKHWYDFWGIAPSDQPNHKWAGITRFKRGFGGEERRYAHALELPLRMTLYAFVRARRSVRSLKSRPPSSAMSEKSFS